MFEMKSIMKPKLLHTALTVITRGVRNLIQDVLHTNSSTDYLSENTGVNEKAY